MLLPLLLFPALGGMVHLTSDEDASAKIPRTQAIFPAKPDRERQSVKTGACSQDGLDKTRSRKGKRKEGKESAEILHVVEVRGSGICTKNS